ncbi:hypothetical protein PG990_013200 [Apiospora arundinis]
MVENLLPPLLSVNRTFVGDAGDHCPNSRIECVLIVDGGGGRQTESRSVDDVRCCRGNCDSWLRRHFMGWNTGGLEVTAPLQEGGTRRGRQAERLEGIADPNEWQ